MRAKKVIPLSICVLILGVLLLVGLTYGLPRISRAKALGASYGLIGSPLEGDILLSGDPLYVDVSFLLSERNLAGADLYVDGEEYSPDEKAAPNPSSATPECPSGKDKLCGWVKTQLLWIPTAAGFHTLSACMSGDELHGPGWSVCTDAVLVTVADLKSPAGEQAQYLPRSGDSLESIAWNYGLPPLLVAAANPGIEPSAELPADIPVNIPADPSLRAPTQDAGSAARIEKAIMTIDQGVDKVYCYYSFGENYWSRMPVAPQSFDYPSNSRLDLTAEFRSLAMPANGGSLELDCWGWNGGTLISLGSAGPRRIEPSATTFQLRGDHFVLEAALQTIPGNLEPRDIKMIIAPPLGLTSTGKLEVCLDHFPPADFFFGPFACKTAVENSDIILIWDWLAPIFPPDDPTVMYLTKINGYHVYEVNGAGKASLIATVSLADKKTLILPGSWTGTRRFMVRAYAGPLESANSNLYTMGGTTSGLTTITIPLQYGASGGREKHKTSGFCPIGLAPVITIGDSQLAAGFYHDVPDDSCLKYWWEFSRAKFGFDLAGIKGPISSAKLSYREDFTSNADQSCASELRVVTTTTSGVDLKDLASDPFATLPTYGYAGSVFNVDVTEAVRDWMLGAANAGFVFIGRDESVPSGDCGGLFEPGCIGGGSDSCWSRYADVKLTATYFSP